MVINDQPNMHMHALSFPCSTDSSCRQAEGDFKSSNQSDTCNTWRIFDTTSYTTLTLLPLPHRRSKHPRTYGRRSAHACTQTVPKPYPNYTRSLRVGSLLHFGITVSGHRISIGVIKSTGGSQWALLHFAFSGHALLSGYAWNWSCYWSCLLSIETSSVTSFMDCIGYFFLCRYYSIMHACMAMVEPVILHPPFMPFFTVQALHHLGRVVGGWKPALS